MPDGHVPRRHGFLAILGLLFPFTFFIFWTKGIDDVVFDGNFNALKVRRDVSISESLPAPIAALNIHFITINGDEEDILTTEAATSLIWNILYTNIMSAFHSSELYLHVDERSIQDSEWNQYFTTRDNQSYIHEDILKDKLYDMFQGYRKYQAISSSCLECTDLYLYLYRSTNQVFIETNGSTNYSNGFVNHKFNSGVLFLPSMINHENTGEMARIVGNQFRALINLNEQGKHAEYAQIISREELVALEQSWINSMFVYSIRTCISYEQAFPAKKKEFVLKWNNIITILNSFQSSSSNSFSQIRNVYVYLLELQHFKPSTPSCLPWDQELAVLAPFWIPIFVPIVKGLYTLYRK